MSGLVGSLIDRRRFLLRKLLPGLVQATLQMKRVFQAKVAKAKVNL